VAAMALGSSYIVMQHLATFLAVSEIKVQEQRLAAANLAAIEEMERHSGIPEKIAAADSSYPGRSIMVLQQNAAPAWLKDGFTGLVLDHGQVHLRAADAAKTARGSMMVVSSVPFDQKLLARIASKLGSLTLTSDFEI